MPYHPSNLKHTPYAGWKVITIAWVAKFLGVHIKIAGIPFGAARPIEPRLDPSFFN